jgi:hypothetical protein
MGLGTDSKQVGKFQLFAGLAQDLLSLKAPAAAKTLLKEIAKLQGTVGTELEQAVMGIGYVESVVGATSTLLSAPNTIDAVKGALEQK